MIATLEKRTKETKRANLKKRPKVPERASKRKSTRHNKRANVAKSTIIGERAFYNKRTCEHKRGDNAQNDYFVSGLVRLFYDVQNIRIGLGLKINNPLSKFTPEHKIALQELYNRYEKEEKEFHDTLQAELDKHPVYVTWLSKIKGIDVMLSASLLYGGIDIRRAEHCSNLIRFCGLGTFEGKAERLVKGEKCHFSTFLKMTCWKVGKSFEKLKNKPTSIYGRYMLESLNKYHAGNLSRHHCERCKTDEQKMCHINAMARRRTVALFLSHLWETWRKLEGLPTGVPYSFTEFGGSHPMSDYIPPMIDDVTQ